MADVQELLVRIDATTEQLRREMARADKAINDFGGRADRSLRQVDGAFGKLNAAMTTVTRALGPLIAGFAVQRVVLFGAEIAKTADQLRLLQARVVQLGGTAQTFEQLRQVSQNLGVSVQDTTNAFSRFRIAGNDIGLTNRQVITLTETVQKLGRIGGATGQELASATQQLAQGLASGRLQGDELRSVMENMPLLARAIAESLGVSVGQLRDLGAEGQLTGRIIADAVLGVAERTDQQFKALPRTLEQASASLETEWGRLVQALDDRLSVSQSYQFFLEKLQRGVGAAADVIAAPTVQQRLRDTLSDIKAIQDQIARTEQMQARPSERGLQDPRRVESDRTAEQRIANLKRQAAELSEVLEREAIHIANLERIEQLQRQEAADAQAADRVKAVDDYVAALQRQVDVARLSEVERLKMVAADKAEADARKKISGITDEQVEKVRAAAAATAAETHAIEEGQKAAAKSAAERKALNERVDDTIAGLRIDLAQQTELRKAHEQGAKAVEDVTDAQEAYAIIQQLKIKADSEEAKTIAELVVKINEQKRAVEGIKKAQDEADRAAEKHAAAQKKAAEDAARAYDKVIDDIARVSQEKLGDALFDHLKGETVDFGEFLKDTLLRAIADIAAAALTQQIVIPIAVQAVGAAPGLFGLSGQAAGVAQSAGGGLFGGGFNPLSSISNIGSLITGGPGSIATSIATSSLGGALGLSAPTGAVFGAEAGIALGGAASGTALTGAGTALVAAAPYLAAAAIALPILLGAFGRKPSVGPTGVARLPNVIGDSEIRLGTDNGGNADAAKAVAQSIRDISTSAADTLGAFGQRAFGLDIGNFSAPESGNSQPAGFNLKEIIDNVLARSDTFKGLTADEAITEGVRLTLQKGFDGFPVAEVSTALSNSAAKTIGDLLSDLDFANAYREMFLPVLDAAGPFETQMDALSDAFDEAKKRAEDLGLTTDGLAVNFAAANDNMKEAFRASLGAEAAGVGGQFGQIIALATQLDQLTTDAALAGVSAETLSTVIDQRLRATVEGLTSGEIQSLIGALSEVRGQVQGADLALSELAEAADIAAVAEGIAAAADLAASIEAENQRMYAALIGEQELRVEALEEEKRALEDVAAASGQAARALRAAAGGLLTDPNFSPLNGLERAQEASRQVEEAFALATDGTPFDAASQDAINRLPDLIRVDLEANRAYYASSEDYLARFNRDQQILNSLASSLESIEQQQLGHLASIDTRLAAAVTALENLRIVAGGGTVGAGGGAVTAPDAIGGGTITGSEFVDRQNAYLANNPDVVAGIAQGWFTSGYDHWIKAGQFEDRPDAFHTGGFPDPGSMFRALPSEIMVHAPSMGQLRVFDPMASAALRGGANDNGEVVSAVNRLSDKLDRLILLMADSGEASIGALGQVAEGLVEVRQAVKRSA